MGNATWSAKRGRAGSCGIRPVSRTEKRRAPAKLSHMHSCLCLCVHLKLLITCSTMPIITGDVLLITCKHVQSHERVLHKSAIILPLSRPLGLQDRLLVMRFPLIDHSASSRCYILVKASWMWDSWENCMMKYNCDIF